MLSINTPTCYLVFLSQFNTLASEVKCLRVIERRDLSNERNNFKSKMIFYHKKTRLKPERATRPIPKRRRRQLQGRSRKEEGLCTRQLATTPILNLSNLLKGSDIKRTSRTTVLLKGSDIKRTSRRTVLLKGSDIKRTSRRTALLKGRNTRTIQLPLRHLKGIGIGMTPLSDWLNVLPRGSGIAGVTELPLPPKGMSWHVVLH